MQQANFVHTTTLILACILLVGVIFMTYGFYYNDSLFVNIGAPITVITSLIITFQNIILQNNKRRVR